MPPDEPVCTGLLPLTILMLASTSIKGNNATYSLAQNKKEQAAPCTSAEEERVAPNRGCNI